MSINPLYAGITGSYGVAESAASAVPSNISQPAPNSPQPAGDQVTLTSRSSAKSPASVKTHSHSGRTAAESQNEPKTSGSGQEKAKAPAADAPAKSSVPASVQTAGGEEWHVAGGVTVQARPKVPDQDAQDLIDTMPDLERRNPAIALGSDGDDEIYIANGDKNSLIVTINGEETRYSSIALQRLIIDGGKGNDRITVDESVTASLRITGGDGDDYIIGGSGNDLIIDNHGANTINGGAGSDVLIAHGVDLQDGQVNTIEGGAGDDYLEGGNGRDVMDGGEGHDALYGLGGADELHGGEGSDYLDGGEGSDTLYGDAGDDVLAGGKGDDVLRGGEGSDVLIGASGSDNLDGEGGVNRIISSGSTDTVKAGSEDSLQTVETAPMTENIRVMGKNEFDSARIESDLETLANTENGQMFSQTLADTGHKVDIRTTMLGSVCRPSEGCDKPGVGSDSAINYAFTKVSLTTDAPWAEMAPIVSLFHEMCHSYNAALGNMNREFYDYDGNKVDLDSQGLRGVEFQAVGIDNPSVEANPKLMTENGFRELLGYKPRERY